VELKRSTLLKVREITVPVLVVAIVAMVAFLTRGTWMPFLANITGQNLFAGSEKAAIAGVEAFGTINYQSTYENWKSALCAVSTKDGCDLLITIADTSKFWDKAIEQKTVRTTKASPVAMIDSNKSEMRAAWKVKVDVTEASGVKTNEVYVVVVKDGGQWKFERFMLGPEIEKYTQKETK
jgi:hypothetical protein